MPMLVAIRGPLAGAQYWLAEGETVLGRQAGSDIELESADISRKHARVRSENGAYLVEDLNSSNGTYLNGKRLHEPARLQEGDELKLGPYRFAYREATAPVPADTDVTIREEVSADPSDPSLHSPDPARQLEAVLAIGQHLARRLEPDEVWATVLDRLMEQFPQADRGLALVPEGEGFALRAYRCRGTDTGSAFPYSRTVASRALREGLGILSEDVGVDPRFREVPTLAGLEVRSLLCVPLIGRDGTRLGVMQLDCSQGSYAFRREDLQLLTAVALQVSAALENAALHAERLREERLRQELALAARLQQGMLPADFPPREQSGFELYGSVRPAREVSGDLYDFFWLSDRRLAFLVGDVSGKGVPAALFMFAVRALARHPATEGRSPSEALRQLDTALTADNRPGIFVTLVYGIYEPETGDVLLASAGHPAPLLRRADGRVEEVALPNGALLGLGLGQAGMADRRLTLSVGETLVLYTDGLTEALAPGEREFGLDGLRRALSANSGRARSSADAVYAAIESHTGAAEPQDDQTMLFLKRLR